MLSIHHAEGEYKIHVGHELLRSRELFGEFSSRARLIVTDENVASLWLDSVRNQLPDADILVLPAGEEHKTLATVERIWNRLADLHATRDALVVALGGGVIGDMAGFAAACWMRGIGFVQLPTTLLAQVDASIGGKTAVDHPGGKNLVGAFHQPEAVIIDTATLETLPEREYLAGFAEIIKAALIADAEFFDWLDQNARLLRQRDHETLSATISRSCAIKAAIVSEDEREQGRRALLNLGHTFAHAIESSLEYRGIIHGEAVSIGLVLATQLSERVCGLAKSLQPRLTRLLREFNLPVSVPAGLSTAQLLEAMRLDKKHAASAWRLILLEAPGTARAQTFDASDLIAATLETAIVQAC